MDPHAPTTDRHASTADHHASTTDHDASTGDRRPSTGDGRPGTAERRGAAGERRWPTVDRRTFLASGCAAVGVLAGCQSLVDSGGRLELGETARGRMEQDPSSEWRATIEACTVQSSAFANVPEDRERVRAADTHFLFAEVDGDLPPNYVGAYSIPYDLPGRFSAVVDGAEYEPVDTALEPDDEVGSFPGYVFEVDASTPVDDAAIRWDVDDRTHEWQVPEATLDSLATRSRTAAVEVTTPETVVDGETVTVELSAENAGDDGRIRAGLYRTHRTDLRTFSAAVPAGERHTWTVDLEADARELGRVDWEFHAIGPRSEHDTASTRIWAEELVP